jgi:hypothetical protein
MLFYIVILSVETNKDPDPGFLGDQLCKILHAFKNLFFVKNCIFFYPYASIKMPKLFETPSAPKRKYPAIQHFITFNHSSFLFLWSFLPTWIRIRIQCRSMRIRIQNTAETLVL